MRCVHCGSIAKLAYQCIVTDSTVKEYMCPNGHKSIVKRYGKTIDMGKHKVTVDNEHTPAYRSKTKTWSRHLHSKTPINEKVST